MQLCFMPVILDSGDSCKWIITSPNRLAHWKVRFQSLTDPSIFQINRTSVIRAVKRNKLSFSSIEINKTLPVPIHSVL